MYIYIYITLRTVCISHHAACEGVRALQLD